MTSDEHAFVVSNTRVSSLDKRIESYLQMACVENLSSMCDIDCGSVARQLLLALVCGRRHGNRRRNRGGDMLAAGQQHQDRCARSELRSESAGVAQRTRLDSAL